MIFKLYECDIGILFRGQRYDFPHVDALTFENPENTRLIRGANASNKVGLVYKEGIKDPKRITGNVMGVPVELKAVLDDAFESKERMDVYCISRVDGSSKTAKNAVLCQPPEQLNIDDSPESLTVALAWESFDVTEVHKS